MPSPAVTECAHDDPPECVSDSGSVRAAPPRARWRTWIGLLAILVAARLVLAVVLAPFAEKSLSRVLGARVDVGDVSFAPIDAIVTLRHVVVHAADEGTAAADAKPPITADRVRIDVQWLPLLHRSLVLRELTLEGARVDLERLRSAGWSLERFQRLEPVSELPPGWSFALDRIVLRDTHVRSRDVGTWDVAGLDVAVRDARVATRQRRATAFGRAPNLRVDAVVDGGRLLIAGSSDPRDDGVAIDAMVHVKDVPLDRLAAFGPVLVGSSITGQVSGRLKYQRDPGRRDRLNGRLRGRHVAVQMPKLAQPALAIRRVEAEIDAIDLLQHRVAIGALTLHGARLAVRPDLVAPVPLLDGMALASTEPVDPRRARRPAPRAPAWSWSVGHLASPFARLVVAGTDEEWSLAADVSGENLGPDAYWSPVRAWIGWDGGTAVFDGTAHMKHGFSIEGRLIASEVDAVAVARAVGPPLATLVQAGRGSADLTVDLALGGQVDPKESPLDVRGRIAVGDVWLAGPDPNAFAFGARTVEAELARVVPGKDGSGFRPAEIGFASASMTSPYVQVTRTADDRSNDAPSGAARSEAEGPTSAVTLAVTDVRARDGRLLIVDELASPTLVLDATVDGWARELRWPAVDVGEFVLQGTDRRLGALRLTGTRSGGDLTAELTAPAVNLAALVPYFHRARLPYAFTAGTGAIRSRLAFAGDRWSADTTLALIEPTLGGDEAVLERSLGMTPEAAFAALRERHGKISLQLPLGSAGWAGGRELNDTVAGAVRDALAQPRLTPLPEAPLQVEFAAGLTAPGPNATRQLAAIAEILVARPDVVVELRGAISRADRRWFAEQAVTIEDADEGGGFRGLLRAVGWRDQRARIRDALSARGAGRPGRLDSADEAALGELVAAGPSIPDDRLAALAAARVALVATLLADRDGVTAARVAAKEPSPQQSAAVPVVAARFLPDPEASPW